MKRRRGNSSTKAERGKSKPDMPFAAKRHKPSSQEHISDGLDQSIYDGAVAQKLDVARNEPLNSLLAEDNEKVVSKVVAPKQEARRQSKRLMQRAGAKQGLTEARQGLTEAEEMSAEAKQGLTEAKQGSTEARQELAEAEEMSVEAKQESAEAKQGLTEAEEMSAEAKQGLTEAEAKLTEAKQELAKAEEKLTEAKKELTEAKKELPEAKYEFEKARQEYGQHNSSVNRGVMDAALKNYSTVVEYIASATQRVTSLSAILNALEQRVMELQREQGLASDTLTAAAERAVQKCNTDGEAERQREVMAAAFNATYQDADNLLTLFDAHVKMCFGLTSQNYYPYTTIVQSSGYGKSRLVKEYAKQAYTIQICLREPFFVTAYPVRWEPVATYLTNASKRRFEVFFMLCVQALYDYNVHAKDQTQGKYEQFEPFYRSFLEDGIKSKLAADLEDKTAPIVFPVTKEPLLICFDEPYVWIKPSSVIDSGIPSIFQNFRHATAALKSKSVLCVLTDTTAKIANFTPSGYLGFSARGVAPQAHLMPPFYFVWTSNLSLESEIASLPPMTKENENLLRLFGRGRPLWKSFLPMTIGTPDVIIAFAGTKLQGGDVMQVNAEVHLAWLACRYCLYLAPQSRFCDALLAGHLATCLWISSERDAVLVSYASEPVLSEASALALSSVENALSALQTLTSALMNGVVEAGYRGELVARILLLPLILKPLETQYFSQAFTLSCYLRSLLGFENFRDHVQTTVPVSVLDGTLQVTHFVPIDYEISCPEQLQALYESRAAAICKRNQKGDDLVIPFKMVAEHRSSQTVYSAIKIQCKNWASKLHFDSVTVQGLRHLAGATTQQQWRYTFSEWADHVPVPPYITLYMQLGSTNCAVYNSYSEILKLQKQVGSVKDADTRKLLLSLPVRAADGQLSFILAGLDPVVYPSAAPIMSELKRLLHAWPDVTSLINDRSTMSAYDYHKAHQTRLLASLDKHLGVQRWPAPAPGSAPPRPKTRVAGRELA